MEIQSVSVTLAADDLRVMASALRIYHRTCIVSREDTDRIKTLIHLAERTEQFQGQCYAEMIRNGSDKTASATPSPPATGRSA